MAFTQKAEPIWSDYFTGPLFVDRIEYLKEIPMIEGTKANIWWDEGNAAIHDKRFVIDGPPWNVLKDFHNKWHDVEKISTWNASISSKIGQQENLLPNRYPRVVGDNISRMPFAFRPNMPNNFRWCTPATYQNFFNIEQQT